MKKRILALLIVTVCALMLASCVCEHTWESATCLAPQTCSVCGETEGEAVGHQWKAADCISPKTCAVCSLTEGAPLGHQEVSTGSSYDFVALTEEICIECDRCGECLPPEVQSLTSLHGGGLFLCDREGFMKRYQAVAEAFGFHVVSEESGQEHEKILQMYPVNADGTVSDSSGSRFCFSFYNEHFPDAESGKFHILFIQPEGRASGNDYLAPLSNILICLGVCDPTLMDEAQAVMDSSDFTAAVNTKIVEMAVQLFTGESMVYNGIRYTFDLDVMCFIIDVVG